MTAEVASGDATGSRRTGSRSAIRGSGCGLLTGGSVTSARASRVAETGRVATGGSFTLAAVTVSVSTRTSRDGRGAPGLAIVALGPGVCSRTVAG